MSDPTTAHWLPIALEPMPGSFERLVIGVAAVDAQGQYEVVEAISESAARCMYGAASARFLGLVDLTLVSLRSHLSARGAIDAWRPPLVSQVHVGPAQYAEGPNLRTIVNDGLALSSSFAGRAVDEEATPPKADDDEPDRWERELRSTVLGLHADWGNRFNRTLRTSPTAPAVRVGFLGRRLVAQFVKLTLRSLGDQKMAAKAKVFDLQLARDYQPMLPRTAYEILAWRDSRTAQQRAMRNTTRIIEDFCDRHELRLRVFSSTDAAVKHIVKAETS